MRHPQWTFRCRTSSRDRCARSSRAPLPRCCRSGSTRRRGGASLSAGSELSGGARLCSPPTHTHTPTAPSSCCAPLTYAPLPMQSAAQDGAKVARAGATGDGGRDPGPGGGEGGETATQGVGAVPVRRAPSPTGPERPNVWGARAAVGPYTHGNWVTRRRRLRATTHAHCALAAAATGAWHPHSAVRALAAAVQPTESGLETP